MLLVDFEIKDTQAGKGAFATQSVGKGMLVAVFVHDVEIISEDRFNEIWLKEGSLNDFEHRVRRGGIRLADDRFLVPRTNEDPCDFINHSADPSILYHCGLGFSRRDIAAGDELTCDYRFFDTVHSDNFIDTATGEIVSKSTLPRDLLRESAKRLLELID